MGNAVVRSLSLLVLTLALGGCASARWEMSNRVSDAATMGLVAEAALACGFDGARLAKSPFPEPEANTTLYLKIYNRKRYDAAVACLNDWQKAHPELEIGLYVEAA